MGRLRGSFFILRKTFRGIRKTFDAASEELLMRHQKVVGCASLGDVTLRLALLARIAVHQKSSDSVDMGSRKVRMTII